MCQDYRPLAYLCDILKKMGCSRKFDPQQVYVRRSVHSYITHLNIVQHFQNKVANDTKYTFWKSHSNWVCVTGYKDVSSLVLGSDALRFRCHLYSNKTDSNPHLRMKSCSKFKGSVQSRDLSQVSEDLDYLSVICLRWWADAWWRRSNLIPAADRAAC